MDSIRIDTVCRATKGIEAWRVLVLLAMLGFIHPSHAGDSGLLFGTRTPSAESSSRTWLAQTSARQNPGAQADAALDALVKAAKAEGDVTFYYTVTENVAKRVADAFTGKYGIRTQSIRVVQLQQRHAAELSTNSAAADVVFQSSTLLQFAEEGIKKGWIQSIVDARLPAILSGEYPAKFNRGAAVVIQIAPWVIAYDSAKVKGSDIPRDWPDVLHPRFRGQILLANASSSAAYNDFWSVIHDRYGESFFVSLRMQSPRWYSSGVPATQALGAGEGLLQVPITPAQLLTVANKGATLAFVTPSYTTGVEIQLAITSRAMSKHPNAGRLLANYLISPEGNRIFNADAGSISVYDEGSLPREYVSPNQSNQGRSAQIQKLLGL